jgi:hypothetical protein
VQGTGINGGDISKLTGDELWLETNLAKGTEIVRLTFAQSRYGIDGVTWGKFLTGPWSLLAKEYADHSIAGTLRINNTLMGTDKWGHFFQQGFWLSTYFGDAKKRREFG